MKNDPNVTFSNILPYKQAITSTNFSLVSNDCEISMALLDGNFQFKFIFPSCLEINKLLLNSFVRYLPTNVFYII